MSALSIDPPFPLFSDQNGEALDDGYIFIGTANLNPITNPIVVYFDPALTITAVQPIRTSGGYPVYQGTPARIYVNSDYSIQVQNKNGSVVYSSLSATARYSDIVIDVPPVTAADVSFVGFKGQVGDVQDLASDDGSDWIGYKRQNINTVATSVEDRLNEPYISVTEFGAVGDNSTSCDAAVAFAFSAALSSGKPLYFPEGTYKFTTTSTTNWDLTGYEQQGITIFGANSGRTILTFPNVTASIALQIFASTDFYDVTIADLQITGAMAGALVVIGRNDFSDPLNTSTFSNLIILNSFNNAAAEALRLNYVLNSNFIGCRGNCFADGLGTNVGIALRCRQTEFCTFTNGSYGNADYGVQFTDGFSFGNVFLGTDHENVDYCVSTETANSGNNTFVGGQFSLWVSAAFRTTASLSTNAITVINGNYSNGASPAPVIDAINYAKIRKIDGTPITTPAIPATTVTTTNIKGKKVLVTFWAGSITQVTVNAVGIGVTNGSVVVEHGQTISMTYTGSPAWLWQPME